MSELPIGWTHFSLKDTRGLSGGKTPSKANPAFWSSPDVPWVSPKDMKKSLLETSEDKISDIALVAAGMTLYPKDSVLMVTRSGILQHTFPVALTGARVTVNQDIKVLRPTQGVSPKFTFYMLKYYGSQILSECSKAGTTVQSVDSEKLESFDFPLPPSAEQTRIAQKLDELLTQVDTLKARIDAIPKLLKRFRQSVLAAAVSGHLAEESRGRSELENQSAKTPLGNLIREMRNGLSAKPNEAGKGIPILRISSVRAGSVDQAEVRFLECDDSERNRYSLKAGDLLFTRYNGTLELVGVCGLVREVSHATLVYPDKLIRVRCNTNIVLPEYLEIFFSAPSTRQRVMELVKSTSGQKGISGQDLKDFVVTYPSLSIQTDVIRQVEQLFAFADQLEAKVASAKTRIDHLTQSILAKAFRGELVPQDPNDEPANVLLERIKAQRAAAPKVKRSRKASA
ncbi:MULTISPECIES: restriction endonuclease subunit S [unclassified Pseudomonas]|uniref:restriction endonuclease subunit S n=1 Tax=unclassified Pseudomonas TaxID=196821 RepID=UPI001CBB2905|nr:MULTISPECIES: restriction endonuclease subunit S [unclassified Pseudomonas]